MRRLLVGVVIPVLLVGLSGCGGTEEEPTEKKKQGTIADLTVTGAPEETPEVDFNAPLGFAKTEREIIDEGPGKGDAIDATSSVTMNFIGINASDGATIDTSYADEEPPTFRPTEVIKGFGEGLLGAHAGDRVLIAVTSKDGYDPTGNQTTVRPGDSLIFVVDVLEVDNPLKQAKGQAVPAPDSVPELLLDADNHPKKFKATETTPKTLDKLGVYPVIKGEGAKVKSGQTVTVEYVGQLYPDGKVFETSWNRDELVTFPIGEGGVIAGWDQGLVGQTVGSRVILTIPSKLGYGKEGRGEEIGPNTDLIFAVDLLAAS